jgi:hypothetical protein
MLPNKWDIAVEAYQRSVALGYRTIPKVLYSDYGGGHSNQEYNYTDEQKKFIDDASVNMLVPKEPIGRTVVKYQPLPLKGRLDFSVDPRVIQIVEAGKPTRNTTAQNLILSEGNHYKGYSCFGGIEGLCITAKGKVFKTVCMQEYQFANIFDNPEFDVPTVPTICKTEKCWCESDMVLTKMSPDEEPYNREQLLASTAK